MKKSLLIMMFLINICFADVPHIFILHLNGINTTKFQAFENSTELRKVPTIQSNMITFDYVWNPTAGEGSGQSLLDNIHDVMAQKAFEGKARTSQADFTDAWMRTFDNESYPVGSPEYIKLESSIKDKYNDALKGLFGRNIESIIDNFHGIVPEEFQSVVSLVETPYVPHYLADSYQITSGNMTNRQKTTPEQMKQRMLQSQQDRKRYHEARQMVFGNNIQPKDYSKTKNMVLLVPHSQGNFYANDLYTYLTTVESFPKDQIQIYGIASTVHKNFGGEWVDMFNKGSYAKDGKLDNYITSSNDWIIDALRFLSSEKPDTKTQPDNITIPFSFGSPLGHNLISVYLADPKARERIKLMIDLAIENYMYLLDDEMERFDLTMKSIAHQRSDITAKLKYNDKVICQSNSCNNEVLYLSGEYKNHGDYVELYFPRQNFDQGKYTILSEGNSGKDMFYIATNPNKFGSLYHQTFPDYIDDEDGNTIGYGLEDVIYVNNGAMWFNAWYGNNNRPLIEGFKAEFPEFFDNGELIMGSFNL